MNSEVHQTHVMTVHKIDASFHQQYVFQVVATLLKSQCRDRIAGREEMIQWPALRGGFNQLTSFP